MPLMSQQVWQDYSNRDLLKQFLSTLPLGKLMLAFSPDLVNNVSSTTFYRRRFIDDISSMFHWRRFTDDVSMTTFHWRLFRGVISSTFHWRRFFDNVFWRLFIDDVSSNIFWSHLTFFSLKYLIHLECPNYTLLFIPWASEMGYILLSKHRTS